MTSAALSGRQKETSPPGPAGGREAVQDGAPLAKASTKAPAEPSRTVLSARLQGAFRRFLALLPAPAGGGGGPEPEVPPLPEGGAPVPETETVLAPVGPADQKVEAGPAPGGLGEPISAAPPGGPDPAPASDVEPPERVAAAREREVEPPELFLELPPAEATPTGVSADEELPTIEIEEPETEGSLVASPMDGEDDSLPSVEIDEDPGEMVTPLAPGLDGDPPGPAPLDASVLIEAASTPSEVGAGGVMIEPAPDDFFTMPEAVFQDRVTDLIGELLRPGDAAAPSREGSYEPVPASPLTLLAGPFLEDLTEEERLSVLQGLRLRGVEAGDIILTEGEAGQSLFLLTMGEVKVFVRDPTGHSVRIGALKEGDVFGEISVLHGRPRTATITAAARGELLELDQESLSRLARDYPRVMTKIEAFSRERSDDREAAAVRAGARAPGRVEAGVSSDLDAHFGGMRLEPRLRLRLADAFLKAGEDRQAVEILIALADDLVQHDFIEKAVALLKKVEEIQRGRAAASKEDGAHPAHLPGRKTPARPDLPPAGGGPEASDRFQDWLLDLVRATVQRPPAGPPAPSATRLLDTAALRAYGRGLLASRLFQGLSEEELLAVIQGLRLLTFEAGDIVLTEGEAGGSVFILATGRVKVFVRNRSGQDVAIDELGEGAFFGEMAAMSSRSRAATVTAASASTLLELDGPALRSILQSYPAVRNVLEQVFIQRATDPHAASVRSLEGR